MCIKISSTQSPLIPQTTKAFLIKFSSLVTSIIFILSPGDSIEQESPILNSDRKHFFALGCKWAVILKWLFSSSTAIAWCSVGLLLVFFRLTSPKEEPQSYTHHLLLTPEHSFVLWNMFQNYQSSKCHHYNIHFKLKERK